MGRFADSIFYTGREEVRDKRDRAPRPEKHDNRGSIVPGKRLVAGVAFFCFDSLFLVAQQPSPELALDEAARAFEQGKTTEAEQKLRPILEKHPSDLRALLLEGAVLDSAGRYSEAEGYYRRALKIAPASAQLLNNLANHYLARGNRSQAREFYLKAVAIDSEHPNANLQLARMSVEEKRGRQALAYLNRLGNSGSGDPVMLELRARAMSLAGECSEEPAGSRLARAFLGWSGLCRMQAVRPGGSVVLSRIGCRSAKLRHPI